MSFTSFSNNILNPLTFTSSSLCLIPSCTHHAYVVWPQLRLTAIASPYSYIHVASIIIVYTTITITVPTIC